MVARPEAIRRAEAPASAAVGFTAVAEALAAAVAGGGNRRLVGFRVACEI
jgi:hypothetical protein